MGNFTGGTDKGFVGFCQKCADHQDGTAALHKARSKELEETDPAASAFHKAMAEHSSTHAQDWKDLGAEAEAQKAQKVAAGNRVEFTGIRGVLDNAPDDERLRLVNRIGGAPIQRKAAASVPRVGAVEGSDEVDAELQDLVKTD